MSALKWIILSVMVLEIPLFALAAAFHSGIHLFGRIERASIPEALVQALIGMLIAVGIYGFLRHKEWARGAALSVHFLGIAGALFGLVVSYHISGRIALDAYDSIRLGMLISVPLLIWGSALLERRQDLTKMGSG